MSLMFYQGSRSHDIIYDGREQDIGLQITEGVCKWVAG
jgi:hypothetical protein